MSFWAHILVFLIALPVSIYVWAACLAVLDNENKMPALLRLTATVTLVLLAIVFIGRDALFSTGLAFVLVVTLHVAGFYAVRNLFVGMDVRD